MKYVRKNKKNDHFQGNQANHIIPITTPIPTPQFCVCVKLQNTTKGLLTKRQVSRTTKSIDLDSIKKKGNVPTICCCYQVNFSLVCVRATLFPLSESWGGPFADCLRQVMELLMNGKACTWLAHDDGGQWRKTAGKLKPR